MRYPMSSGQGRSGFVPSRRRAQDQVFRVYVFGVLLFWRILGLCTIQRSRVSSCREAPQLPPELQQGLL